MTTRRQWLAAAGAGAAMAALSPIMLLTGCKAGPEAGTGGTLAMNGDGPLVQMRKNPGCGCCDDWAKHMEANGFRVASREDQGIYEYKQQLGIPRELVSCHTAEVDATCVANQEIRSLALDFASFGRAIDRHRPAMAARRAADLVHRMLQEKPAIVGIAVGGMPMGSPGMEGPYKDPYDVVAFRKDGTQMVYASR